MSKNERPKVEPPKTESPKPITEEEYLDKLHATANRLEEQLARTNVEIHRKEDTNNCESCHTPVQGKKGGTCPACLGPTIKPPKEDS